MIYMHIYIYIYTHICNNHFAVYQKLTQHSNSIILQFKKKIVSPSSTTSEKKLWF